MGERWTIGQPAGPGGNFYSIVSSMGRVVALQVPGEEDALLIAAAPRLLAACQKLIEAADKHDILIVDEAEALARQAVKAVTWE